MQDALEKQYQILDYKCFNEKLNSLYIQKVTVHICRNVAIGID